MRRVHESLLISWREFYGFFPEGQAFPLCIFWSAKIPPVMWLTFFFFKLLVLFSPAYVITCQSFLLLRWFYIFSFFLSLSNPPPAAPNTQSLSWSPGKSSYNHYDHDLLWEDTVAFLLQTNQNTTKLMWFMLVSKGPGLAAGVTLILICCHFFQNRAGRISPIAATFFPIGPLWKSHIKFSEKWWR